MLSIVLLLGTLGLAESAAIGITDKLQQAEREKAAKQWAPVVWLHPDENFFPSSVNDFLQHVKPSKAANNRSWNTVDGDESATLMSSLPVGKSSRRSFLLASHDFGCSNCPLPKFLFGKKPDGHDSPSVYAIIHSCSMQPTRRESRSTYGLDFEHYDFPSNNGKNKNPLPLQRERQRGHQTTKHTSTAQTKILGVSHFETSSGPFKQNNVTSLNQQTSHIQKAAELYHSNKKRHTTNASVDEAEPYQQHFTITYWTFYPYNRGKSICSANLGYFMGRVFKPRVNGICHGEEVTFGDHVGDWEHVSIQFKGSTPIQMYVSTHTFGAYYTYDAYRHEFLYAREDVRKGIPMSPNYPRTVQLTGSHPVLYAAQGSHGLWGSPGIHQFSNLPLLQDKTGKGTAWETWLNMDLIDLKDSLAMARPHRHWLLYEGYWGNPSTRCHIFMAGFCELAKGPTGIPRKRVNFPCQNITVTNP